VTAPTGRLSIAALAGLPADVERPRYPLDRVRLGVVHLGVGNFHRAHQAVAFDRLLEAGDLRWGICGVGLRRDAMSAALGPQDGLYSVIERDASGQRVAVVGALRRLLGPADGLAAAVARIASPEVAIVTVTVTEKGYDDAGPGSAAGVLAAGLAARRAAGAGGLTAISCDNLQHNGRRLRERVLAEAAPGGDALLAWLEREVAFPDGMVDRIVPATTAQDRADAAARLGCEDAWPVPAEPFSQWVLEDRFAGPRPALDSAGVQFVADVAPWEAMKLRLLNAAHSALAWLGAPAGLATVDLAIAEPRLLAAVERLWSQAAPTLPDAVQAKAPDYTRALLERFRNPTIGHRLVQIAMDGSRKLPPRLLATLADCRRLGLPHDALLDVVAAWMHWVGGRDDDGAPHRVDDPLASRLAQAAAQDPVDAVRALLRIEAVFDDALALDPVLERALVQRLTGFREKGTLAALGG
jgi:fructuronate reductase